MKRDLLFIKDFRPIHGCDGETANLVDDDLSGIPAKDGVYIIASPQTKFVYPKGMSKVIYIGKANSIRRRLKEHQVIFEMLSTIYKTGGGDLTGTTT